MFLSIPGRRQAGVSMRAALRRPYLLEFTALAGSTGIFQASNFVVTLLLAKALGPGDYGAWNALFILTGYLAYLQLGVVNAMHREVPASIGAGRPEAADRIQRTAWSGVVVSMLAGALLLLVLPARMIAGPEHAGALRLMAGYLIGQQCYAYMACYLRATTRFYLLSRQQVILAFGLLFVTLPLCAWMGLRGAVLGQTAVYLGTAIIGLRSAGVRLLVWPGIVWREWLALARVGFPIMLAGVGHFVLMTFDRLFVLYCAGSEFMGQYAFEARALSLSPLVASLVADQMYPRAARAYGKVREPATLVPFFRQQMIAVSACTAAATVLLYFAVPAVVHRFLPAFTAGLAVMPVLLVGTVFLSLCSACGVILTVMNLQGRYLLTQAALIPAGLGLAVALTRAGFGPAAAAWATTVIYALYLAILTLFVKTALRPARTSCAK